MRKPAITMLNVMADTDFHTALARFSEWGISALDLKDNIFGKAVEDLTPDEARLAGRMIADGGFFTQCLSSVIFGTDIEDGEQAFVARHWPAVERIGEIASILRPKWVRLLAAQTGKRGEISDSTVHIRERHPRVLNLYRKAIDHLHAAGCRVAIENEVGHCIFSTPREIVDFFAALERPGRVSLIWDVQNLWSMGSFPSLETYEQLHPLLCSLHLKGGRCDEAGGSLRWASTLEEASWPVADIVQRAVKDGAVESLCLNPSHGKVPEGFTHSSATEDDLQYVRSLLTALPE